jgi:hypothetical protein
MTRDCPKRPNSICSERAFLLGVAALALVVFLLLHESLIGGKGLVPADGVLRYPPWNGTTPPSNYLLWDQYRIFIPQHEFVHQRILEGDFPLWNPHLDCGMPNLASIQGALLFPIQLLLSPLDPFHASGVAAFLKLFLAGWFTMLYLRRLGVSNSGAFLSGLVFSLCGFMIVWLGHPHVNGAMWLPLLLYFVEKTFVSTSGQTTHPLAAPALRAWIGLAMTFGVMLLGGHPPTAIHIIFMVVIYFLFRLAGQGWEQPFWRVLLLAGSLMVGLLLAAAQLLPFLEYYRHSSCGLSSASLVKWSQHLSASTLIHFLIPYYNGSPVKGFQDLSVLLGLDDPINFNERTAYAGILPLYLAMFAVACRRCRFTWFYLCVAVVSLLVVYGLPPFPALVHALPVLRDIFQNRLLLFTAFSLAVLAGLGWDQLGRTENHRRAIWVLAAFWIAIAIGFGGVLWGIVGPEFAGLDPAHRHFLVRQVLLLAGGLLASGIVVFCAVSGRRWLWVAIGLGWTAADLLCFGMGYNPAIPRDRYYPATPAIDWLKQDTSRFRVMGDNTVLAPNTAAIYGLNDVRGCDFMSVRRYEELITGKAGDFWFYIKPVGPSMPESFQLLNVKYVLIPEPCSVLPDGYDLVYTNGIAIYRNNACMDRALAVFDHQVERNPAAILTRVRSKSFDPRRILWLEEEPEPPAAPVKNPVATAVPAASVRITSYEPDEVSIEASLSRPGFLLLLDTYFPGWTAKVNGQPARIYRADYNFRAVSLPAGKSVVRFAYQPNSFRTGLMLSAAGLLVLGAAWFWSRKQPSPAGIDPPNANSPPAAF